MAVTLHKSVADLLCNGDEQPKLLIGCKAENGFILLACAELPSTEERKFKLRHTLAGGVSIVGVALCNAGENVAYEKYETYIDNDYEQNIFLHLTKDGSQTAIQSAIIVSNETDEVTSKVDIVSHDVMSEFFLARCRCDIPISVTLEAKGSWKPSIDAEIDRVTSSLLSQHTIFHMLMSQVLLSVTGCYGLPDDSTCEQLASYTQEEEGVQTRSKKKTKDVLSFDVYTNLSSAGDTDRVPTCSPIISYNTEPVKTVKITLSVDAVSLIQNKTTVSEMVKIMSQSVNNQLLAMKQCIVNHSTEKNFITPEVLLFQPMDLPVIFNAVYPLNVSDEQLENERKTLHQCLCLPVDRPLFRRTNRYRFPRESPDFGYLRNVHLNCPKSKVSDGKQYAVKGNYTYHHYMQDRFDDNKWGCAYRSLQTLVSWFRLQGYTEKDIPSHRDIQQTLVDIGDKEPKFVGSKQWIGSMEVSFVLDTLLGVQSKIMNVSSGADLSSKGRELAQHFTVQGTPIMIGGGVLAHTILGVDYNEITGDISFLILDPHYTGSEDLKTIIDKGWCGWKDGNFWDKNAHYNLCMPQRPKVI